MIKKAKLYGNEIQIQDTEEILPKSLNEKFELKTCISVSAMRSENTPVIVEFEENDLLSLKFTDNTEWIGHPEDIQEIYNKKTLEKRSSSSEDYLFETQISAEDESRGFIKRAIVKVFSVFKPKKLVAEVSMKVLGEMYDKKAQRNKGLFHVDASFNLKPCKKVGQDKFLLLIHGTLSTARDAFGNLNNNETWQDLIKLYDGNILALEHYTLSESPLKNALDFLRKCPEDCSLDILSHSRGGLVADILAKCDHRNYLSQVGFSENELNILKEEDSLYNLMQEINEEVQKKRIKIGKVVRVAAPSSGTTILSRRVDHFFNLVLNAISIAVGIRNPLYETVKSFLLELISQKENADVLPGLNSMMPESLFQKMLNSADTYVVSDLYNISGDSDVSGVNFNSLKVILANLFYQTANDLVVDTNRMQHGFLRENGVYDYLSKGGTTNHFRYFSNSNSCEAILQALRATEDKPAILYTKISHDNANRGVVLNIFSMGGYSLKIDKPTRDVVVIVPGIMGSTLAVDGEDQWVKISNLNQGAIKNKLANANDNDTSVNASGIIKKFYSKIGKYFSSDYDVITLEFDWRKSLKLAAKDLNKQLKELLKANVNVNIVAHSMGGLVVRQCMMDHAATWTDFKKGKKNKFLMLGTPWLGSYLIMEVLTGHSRRVKQLAALDFKHDRKELLEVFSNYKGVIELLPLEHQGKRKFWTQKFWKEIKSKIDSKHMPNPSDYADVLDHFGKYRRKVLEFVDNLDDEDFKNIYYICGKANKTVFDYKYKSRFFSDNEKLVYQGTSHGDGSVTWKTGIPKQLKGSRNLYYTETTHGELANDEDIFDGLRDIIATGSTNKLRTQEPRSRSGEIISDIYEYAEPLTDENAVVKAIFDSEKTTESEAERVNVKVINGDLKTSSYPVMVGHFFMDLIYSAEKALDNNLKGRLSQRLGIGYYPGKIGESEVFFNLKTQPKGAVICGLGNTNTLTSFLLAKTIKLGALKYAMFMRDNYTLPEAKKYASGLSVILIGIGYGKLAIEESLKGILLGISEANKHIAKGDVVGLKPIKELEIVNYYESIASEAYIALNKIKENDARISINLKKGILKRAGAKKRKMFTNDKYYWWYNLQINSVEENKVIKGFRYYSSNGLARVEQEIIGISLDKISYLLECKSSESYWDKKLSKTLFEMLIPNDFKDIFRNQANMVIKLDIDAAQIPWELVHDKDTGHTPASVSSGFIRQLITEHSQNNIQVPLNNNNALVVGDPDYVSDKLPQLPAAKQEAEWLSGRLTAFKFTPTTLINSDACTIMMELFNQKYKILHFAGHGLYAPEEGKIGIAIGNDICIDPAVINQLGYVPEFVFINCCYSGTIDIEDENYKRDRYKLAANVGTQLIDMGVKAIIVSGWAVNDAAADTFSRVFYTNMFKGYDFGNSVQKARMACFQEHPDNNTWGAYQCYGNQFYRFDSRGKGVRDNLEYVIATQVYTDLDNLLIAIRDQKFNTVEVLKRLERCLEKVEKANLLDAIVLEKEALIYSELGKSDIALQKFKDLFLYTNGNFSIEALEQYCTIKTNHLRKDSLKEDLREIEFLTLVGRNPSRLNIVANAYKLATEHMDSDKEKVEYLKKAYYLYVDSYKASTDKYDGSCLDAMSNIIFIGHILDKNFKDGKLLDRLIEDNVFEDIIDVESFLEDFHEELIEYDKTDLDISVKIGMAETDYCLMLVNKDFKPSIEVDIIEKFRDIFNLLYSPRYIYNEVVQIDFLLNYIKDDVIKEQLNKIKEAVKNLLN